MVSSAAVDAHADIALVEKRTQGTRSPDSDDRSGDLLPEVSDSQKACVKRGSGFGVGFEVRGPVLGVDGFMDRRPRPAAKLSAAADSEAPGIAVARWSDVRIFLALLGLAAASGGATASRRFSRLRHAERSTATCPMTPCSRSRGCTDSCARRNRTDRRSSTISGRSAWISTDAEVAIDPASLTALVNRAFDYKGSSLSNLSRHLRERHISCSGARCTKASACRSPSPRRSDCHAGRVDESSSGKGQGGRDSVDEAAGAVRRRAR